MNGTSIDDQLRRYYSSHELSPKALARLRALLNRRSSGGRHAHPRWQPWAVAATVTLVLLGGIAFVLRTANVARPMQPAAMLEPTMTEVAAELVSRHETCRQIEFSGADIEQVFHAMTDLGFTPAAPGKVQVAGLQLTGAHYCMVGGERALHAVFTDTRGRRVSLYEMRIPPGLASLTTASLNQREYTVELVKRDRLLVAMTRPIA